MSLVYPCGPAGSVNLGAAAAPFALDGSAAGNQTGGLTCTATLTTTLANDIIVACFLHNGTAGTIQSIADVAGLTWNLINNNTPGGQPLVAYYAKSTGILTSDVITVTLDQSTFISLHAFGVSGANFTTPLDANGALPAAVSGTGVTASLTTSSADDFLFGVYRMGSVQFPTAGAGWTTIKGQDYMLTEYKIVTATQSGVTIPIGTGTGDQTKGGGHAIVKGP